jgi:hypothetical protein
VIASHTHTDRRGSLMGHLTRLIVVALLTFAVPALASAGEAGAKKPSPGLVYGGQTSQDAPFVLALRRGARVVDHAAIVFSAKCSDGQMLRVFETLKFGGDVPAFIGPGRHFFPNGTLSKTQAFNSAGLGSEEFGEVSGAMTEKIKGKILANGAASGTYAATVKLVDHQGAKVATCSTGVLRWTARSARGQIYAGSTTQQQPVVVELNRQRTKVTDLLVGWGAGCTPTGSLLIGDHLINFPISAGSFGDTFHAQGDIDGGGKQTFDYAIKGRIGKTKASGRLSVEVKDTDGSGVATSTCKTGSVTWSAKTG